MGRGLVTLALLWSLMAAPVHALSCALPNIAMTFNRIADAEEIYVIAVGRFQYEPVDPPSDTPKAQSVVVTFIGQQMQRRGFGPLRELPVRVDTTCVASWCGHLPARDQELIVFLEQTAEGLRLQSHACPDGSVSPVSRQHIQMLRKCLRQGVCSDAQIGEAGPI